MFQKAKSMCKIVGSLLEWSALFEFKESASVEDTNDLLDWEDLLKDGADKWKGFQLDPSLWSVFDVRVLMPFQKWMDRRGSGAEAKMVSSLVSLALALNEAGFGDPAKKYGDNIKSARIT